MNTRATLFLVCTACYLTSLLWVLGPEDYTHARPLWTILMVCLEELVFRKLLLGWLRKRYGTTWAIIGSTGVFTVAHMSLLSAPSSLMVGLVTSFLFVLTGQLRAPILFHAMHNNMVTPLATSGSIALELLGPAFPDAQVRGFLFIGELVLLACLLALYARQRRLLDSEQAASAGAR